MDLNLSADEIGFREEVRAFVDANLPGDIRDRMRRGDESHLAEDVRRWQRILFERGWGAAMWPSEFGGTGWDKTRQYLFDIEWGSTPISRTLQLSPIMGQEECHATAKEVQRRVQA